MENSKELTVLTLLPQLAESNPDKSDFDGLSLKQIASLTGFIKSKGRVTDACKEGQITRTTWYEWKKNDSLFQEALKAIDEFFADELEAAAHNFAFEGDTTLLIFMLKAKRRAKYDDAYARQERAFEKGLQPIEGYIPQRPMLTREEEPASVQKTKLVDAA